MAKKKVSNANHEKPSQKQDEAVKSHSMDSPPSSVDSEKVENLKSLNKMLLKEAVERRQQVDSLVQSKGSLEMELTRSNSEKEALRSEFAQLVQRAAELEVERRVVEVYVAVQVGVKEEEFVREMKGLEMEMREKESEVEERASTIAKLNVALSEAEGALGAERNASRRVRVERDVFEAKLNRQIDEDLGLRANLAELGDKIRDFEREIEDSRSAYNAVVSEKEGMAKRIKLLVGEKDLSAKGLVESNKLIEEMKEEISVIVREREGVEKEKNEEIGKRRELENVVSGLNEMAASLKKEEAKLQKTVAELDKKCAEGEAKLGEMLVETDRLVGEMKLSEKRIKELADEKGVLEKELKDALKSLAERSLELEGLANEKIVILKEKSSVEGQLRELGSHVDELRAAVVELEGSNVAYVDKIRSLESQVGELTDEKGVLEKELKDALKSIGERSLELESLANEKIVILEEKSSVEGQVRELGSHVDELRAAVVELEVSNVAYVDKIRSLESQVGELADEKGVFEKELKDALKSLAERSLELESLANEKIVVLEEKSSLEGQLRELGSHVDELKAAVVELEGSNVAYVDKIRSLESQVGEYKSKLEKVYVEREGLERCLDEEKQNALKLKAKIEEMEKRIEESHKASAEVKTKKAAIVSEKMVLENRCGMLRKEIASLQETMAKLQAEFDSMKSRAEMADANSELVLNMLKGTSAFCSKEECEAEVGNMHVDGEALRVHAVEMETIKKAFKSKAAKVEEMKKQLEVLRSRVTDEQQKKSFWTVLSSATTLLAALSLAYVARGH